MTPSASRPIRILFLCTQNSARSQIAEALLRQKGSPQFIAGSAGTHPAESVNPRAGRVLRQIGIEWDGRPKSIDEVRDTPWDFVITVCDRAKETCPTFPGQPIFAHWGMEDPAAAAGDDEERLRKFLDTLQYLSRRIDLMLALPLESLERRALELRLRAIAFHEGSEEQPPPEAT